jgi:hypothetical protein
MGRIAGDLEIEHIVSHLQIMGWWPVKWKHYEGARSFNRGIRNTTQSAHVQWNKVFLNPVREDSAYTEIEWWELTDDTTRALATSLDNTLVGW